MTGRARAVEAAAFSIRPRPDGGFRLAGRRGPASRRGVRSPGAMSQSASRGYIAMRHDAGFSALSVMRGPEASGVGKKPAETVAKAVRQGRAGLVTKADLYSLETRLEVRIAALRADLRRALRMQGGGFVAVMAALKSFG